MPGNETKDDPAYEQWEQQWLSERRGELVRAFILAVLAAFLGAVMVNHLVPPSAFGPQQGAYVTESSILGAMLGLITIVGVELLGNAAVKNFVTWIFLGAGLGTVVGFVAYIYGGMNLWRHLFGDAPPNPNARWQMSVTSALLGVAVGSLVAIRLHLGRTTPRPTNEVLSQTPEPESVMPKDPNKNNGGGESDLAEP